MRRLVVLLATAGAGLLSGCGSGVNEGQVKAFEEWAAEQPNVESVDSATRDEVDGLAFSAEPEVTTTLHFPDGTSDEAVLAVAMGLHEADPGDRDPKYVVGEREGVTFLLSGDPEDDRAVLALATALEQAAPEAEAGEPSREHPAMVVGSTVTVVVPDEQMQRVAQAVVSSSAVGDRGVLIRVQGKSGGYFSRDTRAGQDASVAPVPGTHVSVGTQTP
ncbi:hypothetical protein CYJ76_10685 [Kytococcus schroeteri]|uniref:Uncharacterized protein n=1 Tax=Kytococcus schroeteri TaxID=138300 RepID=A0A2I1P8B8_9MICO|nr:hypothetical protein [Kytococcus schroeteri]PKZ40879.1 hypothetical protein CYJ76_10685 [Kytococcus schroeteri]